MPQLEVELPKARNSPVELSRLFRAAAVRGARKRCHLWHRVAQPRSPWGRQCSTVGYSCMVRTQAAFHSALLMCVSRSQNPMQSARDLPPPPGALDADALGLPAED